MVGERMSSSTCHPSAGHGADASSQPHLPSEPCLQEDPVTAALGEAPSRGAGWYNSAPQAQGPVRVGL